MQLSENNNLKPIIKKHTFKTKLNKNNQNIKSLHSHNNNKIIITHYTNFMKNLTQ